MKSSKERQAQYAATEKGKETRKRCNESWAKDNREHRNSYMRDWSAKNKVKKSASQKRSRVQFPARHLIYKAKERAVARGWDFDITEADFPVLPSHCPVLGIEIIYGGSKLSGNSPTFDRINNDKGYIKGNVIIVSWRANHLKSDGTVGELQSIVRFYEQFEKEGI